MANPIKWLGAALVLASLCSVTAGAQAGKWDRARPRRAQVNKRPGNQNKPIGQGVRNGTLTRGQGQQLHQDDQMSRQTRPQKHPAPAAP